MVLRSAASAARTSSYSEEGELSTAMCRPMFLSLHAARCSQISRALGGSAIVLDIADTTWLGLGLGLGLGL